jgi:peptide deformylase
MAKHREFSEMMEDKSSISITDVANFAVMSRDDSDHNKTVKIEDLIAAVIDNEIEKLNGRFK